MAKTADNKEGFLTKIINLLMAIVDFLTLSKQSKIDKQNKKEQDEFESEVDKVCNTGSIDDLLDLKR